MPQFGEDEVIAQIFSEIDATSRFFVDIGAGCRWSNVEFLEELGWYGLKIDKEYGQFVTKENVNELLEEAPDVFDFLSIDIDGNDYWVWKEITKTPRVVCIEYEKNAPDDWIMDYNESHEWDNHSKVGAGRQAMIDLATSKGYRLYGETGETNLFFVKI